MRHICTCISIFDSTCHNTHPHIQTHTPWNVVAEIAIIKSLPKFYTFASCTTHQPNLYYFDWNIVHNEKVHRNVLLRCSNTLALYEKPSMWVMEIAFETFFVCCVPFYCSNFHNSAHMFRLANYRINTFKHQFMHMKFDMYVWYIMRWNETILFAINIRAPCSICHIKWESIYLPMSRTYNRIRII